MAHEQHGGRRVDMVIDLTNSSRYYDPATFSSKGVAYHKVPCVGKDAPPDPVAVSRFVHVVGKFMAERAQRRGNGLVLVHCTHGWARTLRFFFDSSNALQGLEATEDAVRSSRLSVAHRDATLATGFNRTGAMLVHYMQRTRPWPTLNENLAEFARARPPGIYKADYVKELFDEYLERRYRTTKDPGTPEWKREPIMTDAPPLNDASVPVDDLFGQSNADYVQTKATSRAPLPEMGIGFDSAAAGRSGPSTTADGNADGTPMHHDDVIGEEVCEEQALEVRNIVLYLCGQDGSRFPGSQPVSLARDNMDVIKNQQYHVTWKADGTRYMLLLLMDGCYLIDRKFAVRRVQMRFPAPLKMGVVVHHATLLDGEMVVDDLAPGKQRRRFLAYDLMALFKERLFNKPFVERISLINSHVIQPRNLFLADAGKSGSYNFSKEPFSIRQKDFFPLDNTEGIIRDFIPKLTHECDGLIFQPSKEKYLTGTMDTLLKWKFTHLNSVDFLLKLVWVPGTAPAPRLYVGGQGGDLILVEEPSGEFTLGGVEDPDSAPDGTTLSDLDGQIVECTWDKEGGSARDGEEGRPSGAWRYLRVRTDKDTPNFVTVYRHTLQSILDDITSEEIVSFVGGIVRGQQGAQ